MSRNVLSIIKSSNNTFKQSATSDLPSTTNEIMIGQDDETVDNYILSTKQNTTIKSHSTQEYAPAQMPTRSREPVMPLAEQHTITFIIDVSNDEFNIIVSQKSDSKPEISESPTYTQRLNYSIDETDISLDGSNFIDEIKSLRCVKV